MKTITFTVKSVLLNFKEILHFFMFEKMFTKKANFKEKRLYQ